MLGKTISHYKVLEKIVSFCVKVFASKRSHMRLDADEAVN